MPIEYYCPACLHLGIKNKIHYLHKICRCRECQSKISSYSELKVISLLKTFYYHNKQGYKCPDCERFIPQSDLTTKITCPYLDCCYVGNISDMTRMHHPNIHSTNLDKYLPRQIILPSKKIQLKNNDKINLIISIIKNLIDNIPYESSEFTQIHKRSTYNAFINLLIKYEDDMIDYLFHKSRNYGFQHKIFQEYVSELEKSLPYSFKKNNKFFTINSLLDPNLNIFDGISEFESELTPKLEILNETKEIYIGSRNASYVLPYYIGKLLDVISSETNESLMHLVSEYSFSKIKLIDLQPGLKVLVRHLRIVPHYQLGGMLYINRLKKKIVDAVIMENNRDIDL